MNTQTPAISRNPNETFNAVKRELQKRGVLVPEKGTLTKTVRDSILLSAIFDERDPEIIASLIAKKLRLENESKLFRFIYGGGELAAAGLN